MSGGIETYRNGVWCELFSVENCNGKNMWTYWDNDIKVEYSKYDCLYAVGLVLLSKYLISIKADSVISGFCKTAQRM